MTNSELFKRAHAMTRATIQPGDSYQATFGQCLIAIKAQHQEQARSQAPAEQKTAAEYIVAIIGIIILFLISMPVLGATGAFAGATIASAFDASLLGAKLGSLAGVIATLFIIHDAAETELA